MDINKISGGILSEGSTAGAEALSGDFETLIGNAEDLKNMDALGLLKAQQELAKETQMVDLISKVISKRSEADSNIIRNM